eukprot:263075-Alexandrium_andersonii.AAC.1
MPPKVLRPTGGWRQRLAANHASADLGAALEGMPHSHLVDRILQMWSWGLLSAPSAQVLAEGAVLDGSAHPALAALAKIGSSGRWPHNAQRDLNRNFLKNIAIPEVYTVAVPAQVEPSHEVQIPILLPHQLFAMVAGGHPALFAAACHGNHLREFWAGALQSQDPQLHEHPMMAKPDWNELGVPMVLYGDGAAFAKRDSLEVVAFSFLLARGSTWSTKYVLACFAKSAELPGTWSAIFRVLLWSFRCMFEGTHPNKDHLGRDWPTGSYGAKMQGQPLTEQQHFGVIHRVAGDLDYFHKRLGCRLGPSANKPCCWCEGGRPSRAGGPQHGPPFLELHPGARWITTIFRPPAPPPSDFP